MASSSDFLTIDLSRLPAPTVVASADFEAEFAALLAEFRARYPGYDALLESDPVYKLLEAFAYRLMLAKGAINDAARGTMLAYATGGDLDNLAALFEITRLTITPATPIAPAVMESDNDLRWRIQLAPELLTGAGMTGGGYRVRVRTLAPSVKDVAVLKPADGRVDLVLLGREGDGTVPADVVQAIVAAYEAEDAAQLTDIITVRSARIFPYSATITLTVRAGPDPSVVRSAADAAVRAYAADRHRIGAVVYGQMLEAAASVGSVERASLDFLGDIDPGADGAAFLSALTIVVEVQR